MTSVTLNQAMLHTVPSIVTQFSIFKILYAYIFHTLPCHMFKHVTSKALNFQHCKSITCRYFVNFLQHLTVRCFVAISIALQTITIKFFRSILLLFNHIKLSYNSLTLSFFSTRALFNTSLFFTHLL